MSSHERAAVKTCTKCGIAKGLESFSRRQSWCKQCINEYSKAHYRRTHEHQLERAKIYKIRNPEIVRQANKKWRGENAERLRDYLFAYREANRDKLLADKKAAHPEYYAKNKAKYLAKFIARREVKRRACPAWADRKAIEAVYKMAQALTEMTGIPHEVDHIVPLQSKRVSGLHVPANLRVISRDENRRKANVLIEDIV